MATKTLLTTSTPDNNYENGANWQGGVAPVTGDTVIIGNVAHGGPGPITATGVAIQNQQIQLTGIGTLGVAGGTSFDAQTTLTGTSDNSGLFATGAFTTAGVITDTTVVLASGGGQDIFTNTGTITYNRAPASAPAFAIETGDLTSNFINNGTINVTNQPGGQLTGGTAYPTFLQISTPFSGNGVFNITGDHPNAAAPTAYVGSQAMVTDEPSSVISGNNTFNLNDGELYLDSQTSGTINFLDASGILVLNFHGGAGAGLGPVFNINSFRAGDVIDLGTSTVAPGSLSYNSTTDILSFTDSANNNVTVSLHIVPTGSQTYTTASFSEAQSVLDTDQSIVTTAAAPCYCPGTLILTDRGEVAVEDLRIGDRLVTGDGAAKPIKWIGRRAYAGAFIEGRRDILPVCIRAGALADNLPRRDLHVSPLHAMFLRGVLVPAGLLVNGATVLQAEAVEEVHYIHLELEQHAVIYAEGAASESFVDDNSRGMFHNAHEFAALYPGQPRAPAVYCAPRVTDGEQLAAINRAVDGRAGLLLPAELDRLRGAVDGVDGRMVRGWAQQPGNPEAPVCVEVLVDGRLAGRTLANLFRADLRAAGLGSGRHAFTLELPNTPGAQTVEVRRASDGWSLGALSLRKAA